MSAHVKPTAANTLEARPNKAMARLQNLFYVRQRSGERSGVSNRALKEPVAESKYFLKLPVALASLALVVGFFYGVNHYRSTLTRVLANPAVFNLSKANFKARINFGTAPQCGDRDCWTEPQFDDRSWLETKIPMDPSAGINTQAGYKNGLKANSMYYRFIMTLPPALLALDTEIAFSPLSIQHRRYNVYINGRETQSGENKSSPFKDVIISIPRSEIQAGTVQVTIKTSVAPGDVGIANYNPAVVGPEADIADLQLSNERESTFYLFFLLTKGSIFTIFTFFFLFTKGSRGLASFMVFAFFSSIENLFIGGFFPLDVKWIVLGFYPCRAIAISGLLGFFMSFFQVHRSRRVLLFSNVFIVSLIVAMALDFGWFSATVTFKHLWMIVNLYLVGAIFVALLAAIAGTDLWKNVGHAAKYKQFFWMKILLGLYFVFIIYETYFKVYSGFDMRSAVDLFFFVYLAYISVKEFGIAEGRIVTLESHMVEKQRMEAELQEAAEIAKTFIPSRTPDWPDIKIDYFHQSLTENSGDWFAFESSITGNYKHFILCDITGHGVQAAIVVSTCKSVLASLRDLVPNIAESTGFIPTFMQLLNHTLFKNGYGRHASTMLGITFADNKIHYTTAGHPSPLILNFSGEKPDIKSLSCRGNVLGVKERYEEVVMRSYILQPGDVLLAFTDGFPVTANFSAFRNMIAGYADASPLKPQELYTNMKETLIRREKSPTEDDVSIVMFKFGT